MFTVMLSSMSVSSSPLCVSLNRTFAPDRIAAGSHSLSTVNALHHFVLTGPMTHTASIVLAFLLSRLWLSSVPLVQVFPAASREVNSV
jgi:hypothetical protein